MEWKAIKQLIKTYNRDKKNDIMYFWLDKGNAKSLEEIGFYPESDGYIPVAKYNPRENARLIRERYDLCVSTEKKNDLQENTEKHSSSISFKDSWTQHLHPAEKYGTQNDTGIDGKRVDTDKYYLYDEMDLILEDLNNHDSSSDSKERDEAISQIIPQEHDDSTYLSPEDIQKMFDEAGQLDDIAGLLSDD